MGSAHALKSLEPTGILRNRQKRASKPQALEAKEEAGDGEDKGPRAGAEALRLGSGSRADPTPSEGGTEVTHIWPGE